MPEDSPGWTPPPGEGPTPPLPPPQPGAPSQPISYIPAGTPGPGGYPPNAGTSRTNGKAIGALVAAIIGPLAGIFCYCLPMPIAGVIAVVLARVGRGEIRGSGGAQTGEGLALAGEIIGWIEIGLVVILVPLTIVVLVLLGNQVKNVFSNISVGLGS